MLLGGAGELSAAQGSGKNARCILLVCSNVHASQLHQLALTRVGSVWLTQPPPAVDCQRAAHMQITCECNYTLF